MKKILIYGTSNKALRELPAILMTYTLIGFVDSDIQKQHQNLFGLSIYHFNDIQHLDFELIIICSEFSIEIEQTLKSLGITNFINSDRHFQRTKQICGDRRLSAEVACKGSKYNSKNTAFNKTYRKLPNVN